MGTDGVRTLHDGRRIYLAIIRDLSDFRMVERENRLLATALNHAGEAVAITDTTGRIVYVNRAFEQITGYSRHEVHGQNPRILASGQTPVEEYRTMWQTLLAGGIWRGEFINRRKDGSTYPESKTISAIRDERGCIRHYLGIGEDLNRRHQFV